MATAQTENDWNEQIADIRSALGKSHRSKLLKKTYDDPFYLRALAIRLDGPIFLILGKDMNCPVKAYVFSPRLKVVMTTDPGCIRFVC